MFEKIKKKPEHIRIKYLWISVAICMFFISLIWLASLKRDVDKLRESNKRSLGERVTENLDISNKINALIEGDSSMQEIDRP